MITELTLRLLTIVIAVQAPEHEAETPLVCAQVLCELLKVQLSILISVSFSHNLLWDRAERSERREKRRREERRRKRRGPRLVRNGGMRRKVRRKKRVTRYKADAVDTPGHMTRHQAHKPNTTVD